MADKICNLLNKCGCRSIHIGGGEPFLDINGLLNLLQAARDNNITVEYVETNAFWVQDEDQAHEYLQMISKVGVDTLCISLDPFHAEYVPTTLPIKLAEICSKTGFGYFLWQDRFRKTLSRLHTPNKVQSRADLERQLSPNYVIETAQAYGLRMGGRALSIEAEYGTPIPVAQLINTNQASHTTQKKPCRNLLAAGHFHVDLYGRYIPPGCTGIAIPLEEAIAGVPKDKYPAFDALVTGGVMALYDLAHKQGFKPQATYTSSCALCFHLRHWLSTQDGFPELDAEHYAASLMYT